MKRFRCLIFFVIILAGLAKANESEPVSKPVPSPDGLFEAYSTPAWVDKDVNGAPFYAGEMLYVRMSGSKERGLLVRENDRWIDYQWAPHSHLLGVEDGWDGHQTDVYVYAISQETTSRHLQFQLVFRSPDNDYDRKWSIDGWGASGRVIHLRFEQWNHHELTFQKNWLPGLVVRHCSFIVGSRPLSEKN